MEQGALESNILEALTLDTLYEYFRIFSSFYYIYLLLLVNIHITLRRTPVPEIENGEGV